MPLVAGELLNNRYRVGAQLGAGGMAIIYRGWDQNLELSVAIKEMRLELAADAEAATQFRQQFRQEAQVLARLNHPHLANVLDSFTEGENAYLVMAFVEGESLQERVERQGALPEKEVVAWAEQLLDALAYCHRHNVIHRDVKPANVIIRPGGEAVLVDFGLVKVWDPENPETQPVVQGMGTLEYTPPEQYYGDGFGHTDGRSDLYSLGATLYHALTGQAPPAATDRMARPGRLTPPRAVGASIGARTEAVILKALALRMDERYPTAEAMAAALTGPLRWPVRLSRRASILAVLLLLALVGGVALILIGGEDAAEDSEPLADAEQVPAETTPVSDGSPTVLAAQTELAPTATAPLPTPSPSPIPWTATPSPTPTASPSPTRLPTVTPPPTPSCPRISGPFAAVWSAVQDDVGCAAGSAVSGVVAEENFERGKMFWREPIDYAQALILFDHGTWRIYQHSPFVEGSPEFSCVDADTPPQCPPTPRRGFGMMWCDIPEIRSGLGDALDCERAYQGTMQQFERGFMLGTDGGLTYVFYDNGRWERR